ncbi:MAG: gamma-glutamyltransferase [bacterium]|nr:gamma-glutamyltransferase [bacterium]
MTEGQQVAGSAGVVVAESARVARAGGRILEQGGNAFDAAAAACLACSMVHPDKCGVGGYLLTGVAIDGASGRAWSIDANSRAPAAAHATMYRVGPLPADGPKGLNATEYDCSVRDDANVYGALAVGVPGQMAGIGTLHERWGRLAWPRIVQPSLDLLADGILIGPGLAQSISNLEDVIRRYPATSAHLLPDDVVPTEGAVWHRPHMERTLERLAQAGWRDFYDGEIAGAIVDSLSAAGGILTRQDMATFQPRISEPYAGRYREAEILGAILPNGPISVLQALNMLDCFDKVDVDDVIWWHRMTEVLKLVWRDRLTYLADPDYADVPIERLLNRDYARGLVEDLLRFPQSVDQRPFAAGGGVPETSHVSTADSDGNVVSATITQGGGFGSVFTVPGWGIILGHGMCRMDPRPGRANSVAGGKRPLNNVMTMVIRDGERDIALGMPGGRRIISVAPQLVSRLIDAGATCAEAALAPRMHVMGAEPVELDTAAPDELAAALEGMGHNVIRRPRAGGHAAGAEFIRGTGTVCGGGGGVAVAV